MSKLPHYYRNIVFAAIMSLCTSLIVSGVIIGLHASSMAAFLNAWPRAVLTAWPLVMVAILIIAPQVYRFVDYFVERSPPS